MIPVPRHAGVRIALLLLAWLIVIAVFAVSYSIVARSILDEIRAQARAVAIALAAAIDPQDVEAIQAPADAEKPAFSRIQRLLEAITDANPDVRYAYVMRRDPRPEAPPSAYVYVVDEPERDRNGNGVIDPEETSQPIGAPYNAAPFPEMVEAWLRPTADKEVTADPPYPDSISGYAPIRDAEGNTVAIVGVDILADTVRLKKRAAQHAAVGLAISVNALITMVLVLYRREYLALEKNRALSRELAFRNDVLRDTNRELERLNRHFEAELKLARDVQLGFLPRELPQHARLAFDRCFVTCAMLGGDLYDAFDAGRDRIALYVADVAGHGASAALIAGLLKMAVETLKTRADAGSVIASPAAALAHVNHLITRDMPADKFITMIYAVLDLEALTCRYAAAGHPPPAHVRVGEGIAELHAFRPGPALGIIDPCEWPENEIRLSSRDKLIFYTDGIPEAMNERLEEFGESRFLEILRTFGHEPAPALIERLNRALCSHRGGRAVSDDYTVLVAEFR